MLKRFGLLVLVFSCLTGASAQARLRYNLGGGYEYGGSEMLRVATSSSQYSILGGTGVLLNFGVSTENAIHLGKNVFMDFQLNLGAKIDSFDKGLTGNLGKASVVRYPVEFLSFARISRFRLGGGLTYHMGGMIEQKNWNYARNRYQMLPYNSTSFFSSGLGLILQAEYFWQENLSLGLKYTAIQYYEPNQLPGDTVRGNSIGLIFNVFI